MATTVLSVIQAPAAGSAAATSVVGGGVLVGAVGDTWRLQPTRQTAASAASGERRPTAKGM
jgi:hypothetical protein